MLVRVRGCPRQKGLALTEIKAETKLLLIKAMGRGGGGVGELWVRELWVRERRGRGEGGDGKGVEEGEGEWW